MEELTRDKWGFDFQQSASPLDKIIRQLRGAMFVSPDTLALAAYLLSEPCLSAPLAFQCAKNRRNDLFLKSHEVMIHFCSLASVVDHCACPPFLVPASMLNFF